MKINEKYKVIRVLVIISLLFIALGLYRGLKVTSIEYFNAKIPQAFDGYKIVQITDLHCAWFGNEQNVLVQSIVKESPDLIVITGDMFDKKKWDYSSMQSLLVGITDIAPIYAVTGNNEYDDSDMYASLMELYKEYGVTVLADESVEILKDDSKIYLHGIYYRYYVTPQYFSLRGENNQFNIVLYHDPSQFEKLSKNGFDLILAGHTHGGVIRLPFVGGIINNAGGVLPKYDYGMFYSDTCDMFVSTGLGNIEVPRFYNRPEIVAITLKSK